MDAVDYTDENPVQFNHSHQVDLVTTLNSVELEYRLMRALETYLAQISVERDYLKK
jgi:hypothetical protein